MARAPLVVRCPACNAKTKVDAEKADRPSITCPRCKSLVVLANARPLVDRKDADEDEGNGARRGSPEPAASRSPRRGTPDASRGPTEFEYPDFFSRWKSLLVWFTVLIAIGVCGYIIYTMQTAAPNENPSAQFMDNLREQHHVLKEFLSTLEKKQTGPESLAVLSQIKDNKGKMEYMENARRRFGSPAEADAKEAESFQQKIAELQLKVNEIEQKFTDFVKAKAPNLPLQSNNETLTGTKNSSNLPEPPRVIDDVSILMNLPGITRAQVTDAMLLRLGSLADNKTGKAKAYMAGDLVSVAITPVEDPAKFASRIDFGQVSWYSRKDRGITIVTDFEKLMGISSLKPDDPLTLLLADLRDSDKPATQQRAFEALDKMEATTNRAAVTVVLEALLNDQLAAVREKAVMALPTWGGKESIPLLIRMLDDPFPVVRWRSMEKLAQMKAAAAALAITKTWQHREADKTNKALIAIGPEAEPAVIASLSSSEEYIRLQACRVLKEIGTVKALAPLTDMLKDQNKNIETIAQDAMKAILERKKNEK